jgi:uncharacterized protein (TIGR03086 family)
MTPDRFTEAAIEADANVPLIRITRDFSATPAQLMAAHLDPELFRRWVGPDGMDTEIVVWDARDGGEWRYVAARGADRYSFRGCFHTIGTAHIIQTFMFEPLPDHVALETLRFENLGDGTTRLHAQSLVDSFESRDTWMQSGMESGVNEGYAKLDRLLADGPTTSGPAENHRRVAGQFSRFVSGVGTRWNDPTPVAEWTVRDIVGHLVEWLPAFLESSSSVRLPAVPSVDEDPVGAWEAHRAAVQAVLDDPATADKVLTNPHIGELPLADAVDRFYTADVFMHTWDLARATDQDRGDTLDADTCQSMVEGMAFAEEAMRGSGQYGPRVVVADDASPQDRLVAFIGRDPAWRR